MGLFGMFDTESNHKGHFLHQKSVFIAAIIQLHTTKFNLTGSRANQREKPGKTRKLGEPVRNCWLTLSSAAD